MKAINIAGFLFITFAAGTIQTMEKDDPNMFFNEKMLLDGDISVEQYLLNLENLDDKYANMLWEIRVAGNLGLNNDVYERLIWLLNDRVEGNYYRGTLRFGQLKNAARYAIQRAYGEFIFDRVLGQA